MVDTGEGEDEEKNLWFREWSAMLGDRGIRVIVKEV